MSWLVRAAGATSLFILAGCGAGSAETTASTSARLASSPDLVISQVYGGGGNPGASRTHDFVELFNRGAQPVSLQGKSLQYASATGAFQSASNVIALPNATLQPGRYFLVQLGTSGAAGAALPTADLVASGAQAVNISGAAGKIALVESNALLNGCGTTATPCAAGAWIDFVGYGAGVTQAEGTAAAAASNTTSLLRADDGCVDVGSNATDFATGAPSPRNGATPARACGDGGLPPPVDAGNDTGSTSDGGSIDEDASTQEDAGGGQRDAGKPPSNPDGGRSGPGPTAPPSETDEPSHTSSPSCAIAHANTAGLSGFALMALAALALRRRRR
jgi:hypothetical protein